jgi:hypothetical protein
MGTSFVAMVLAASFNCLTQANATGVKALAQWEKNDYAGAAQLEKEAATRLEQCLAHYPQELNGTSRQRMGELFMYAGEYASDNAEWQSARLLLVHAKDIFAQLRTSNALDRGSFDEVLSDAHQTDRDLAKVNENVRI